MKHEGSTFLSGVAALSGYFFFAKEIDAIAQEHGPNSIFCFFDDKEENSGFFSFESEAMNWTAISFASTKPPERKRLIVSISPKGDYFEFDFNNSEEVTGKISGFSGNLRRLANIENQIYACGLGDKFFFVTPLMIGSPSGQASAPTICL